MKCTISSESPRLSQTSAYLERATISRLRSTATLRVSRPSSVRSPATVSGPSKLRVSPFSVRDMVSRIVGAAYASHAPATNLPELDRRPRVCYPAGMSGSEARPLIAILNGPNMNMLGLRQPHLYGSATLDDVEQLCAETGERLELAIDFRQSNIEGELVSWVQECR